MRNHRLQAAGQLGAHIGFLFRRKHVHQPFHRLRRAAGVQRRQHQVAGLRRGERQPNGGNIAQLAQQDHIRIFAQRGAQRRIEAVTVAADLPLLDQRTPAAVQEFDRILQRQNVPRLVPVDLVDHRRQRGGLAAAGGAGEQEKPVVAPQQRRDDGRRRQLGKRRRLPGDAPQRERHPRALLKNVGPQPFPARPVQRQIDLPQPPQALALLRIQQSVAEGLHALRRQRWRRRQRLQFTVDAQHRRMPGTKVQIGSIMLYTKGHEFIDIHITLPGQ